MKIFVIGLALVALGGLVLALYERRKGKTLLAHDLRNKSETTDSEHMATSASTMFQNHPHSY